MKTRPEEDRLDALSSLGKAFIEKSAWQGRWEQTK
ncbi:hypothetical protein chiPu_0032459, partial [Chiloscyllium punctatum]|nr:hypothetical protein [Chiloscyllium punctatum]